MKNIYSNIFKFNKKNLSKCIKYLQKSDLVALPTETVYGLAGNAYSKKSILKIYKIKKRPRINPLIIHYSNYKNALRDVEINQNFTKLYNKFCPGPITFILKKKKKSLVLPSATAKLNTIAVRFPSNYKIRQILKKLTFPLAMPSANISSKISPVDAKDVFEEFGKKIKMIVDGGRSKIGVESTVLDLTKNISILRPGSISAKQIKKIVKKKITIVRDQKNIKSPGALKKHYSPGIKMLLNQNKSFYNHAFIVFGRKYKKSKNIFNLSSKNNLNEAAKNLYKIFRKIKKLRYKKIYVASIPNKGIGIAINDRLKKAAN